MKRRKKRKNSKVTLAFVILLSLIVLFFLFNYAYKFLIKNKSLITIKSPTQKTNQVKPETPKYYIGKKIDYLKGKVKYQPKIGYFFYELIDNNGNIFGLRSSKYTIGNYEGKQIKLKGKVVDFYKDIPIIEISELNSTSENNQASTGKEEKKENTYYFNKYGLIIDFGENSGKIVKFEDNNINIYSVTFITGNYLSGNNKNLTGLDILENTGQIEYLTSSKLLVKISPFYCKTGSNIYDCKKIYYQFKKLGFDNFTSANGITFFKIPETNQRFATNNFIWGYYIYPKDEQILYKVSKYIYPYDIQKLKNQLSETINDICKNEQDNLYEIKNFDIKTSGDNLIGILNGTTQNGFEAICKIKIDFEKNLPIVKLINFEIKKQNNKNTNLEKNQNIIKISTGNGLTTTFSHGFNVRIPTKNVAYKQGFEKTNLGIQNLNCDYVVKIIYWKTADKIDTDPDIKIYRCESALDRQSLEKLLGNNIIIKQLGKYYYIIEFKPNREDIAKKIKIFPL